MFEMPGHAVGEILRLSVLYFTAVFVVGAMLAPISLVIFQPYIGARYAELVEIPIMLAWIWQAAQLILWQLDGDKNTRPTTTTPILIGIISLTLLLIAELSKVAIRQGGWSRAVEACFVGRGFLAGSAYALILVFYAAMPWYVWKSEEQNEISVAWDLDVDEGEEYCDR